MRRVIVSFLRFSLTNVSSYRFYCNNAASIKETTKLSPFSNSSKNNNLFTIRTHTCGELRQSDVGKRVRLCGWLHYNRGKFIVLRDSYGLTQIMVSSKLMKKIKKINFESILKIEGTVVTRPDGQANSDMATGEIEIIMEDFELLNSAIANLPFEFRYEDQPTDEIRLRYRYLDLRREDAQRNLRFRSDLVQRMRRFLHEQCSFVEVETPTLFRRTPGGAAEFVVPSSEYPGKFYCLPQSPQQYKQLLMIGGMDRYFQVARCYRDEGGRPDRQPEFTQIDVELSFTTQLQVMELIEQLIIESWPKEMDSMRPRAPFLTMGYHEAMIKFGSDKPDLRFRMEIENLNRFGLENTFCIGGPYKIDDQIQVDEWNQKLFDNPFAIPFDILQLEKTNDSTFLQWRNFHGDGGLLEKLNPDSRAYLENRYQLETDGGILIFATSPDSLIENRHFNARKTLGFLRLRFADYLETKGIRIRSKSDQFAFLWVIDFPLFLPIDGTTDQWESAHHPFTAPIADHVDLLIKDPGRCIGQHYDLVLNGVELGGGSMRIHDAQTQKYVLEKILREDPTDLKHLLDALETGAPPHGGFAIGLDRYLAILLKTESIRDVIAFPKTRFGRDPMSDAPAPLTLDQLKRFHINVDVKDVQGSV